MLDFLNNLKLTTTHYIAIAGALAAALFLVYYFFFSGPSIPQGAFEQAPPGAPLYKEMEHYEDMQDHGYDDEAYEDYADMPELEPAEPQQQQPHPQQPQQPQEPVAHGNYPQEQFQGGEPMAANAGAGGFQSW